MTLNELKKSIYEDVGRNESSNSLWEYAVEILHPEHKEIVQYFKVNYNKFKTMGEVVDYLKEVFETKKNLTYTWSMTIESVQRERPKLTSMKLPLEAVMDLKQLAKRLIPYLSKEMRDRYFEKREIVSTRMEWAFKGGMS